MCRCAGAVAVMRSLPWSGAGLTSMSGPATSPGCMLGWSPSRAACAIQVNGQSKAACWERPAAGQQCSTIRREMNQLLTERARTQFRLPPAASRALTDNRRGERRTRRTRLAHLCCCCGRAEVQAESSAGRRSCSCSSAASSARVLASWLMFVTPGPCPHAAAWSRG